MHRKKFPFLERILKVSLFRPIVRNLYCVICFNVTSDVSLKHKIGFHFIVITVVLEMNKVIH